MDYIGSKVSLNPWLFSIIEEKRESLGLPNDCYFLDACSGSGAVSRFAAKSGYRVLSNDIMKFPAAIVNGSIGVSPEQKFIAHQKLESSLENEGFFFSNYSAKANRSYFTDVNASRIDGCRSCIGEIVDPKVRDYSFYCCLQAMSRVLNTTGIQSAFLKQYKARALDIFRPREEETVDGWADCFHSDILELLKPGTYRSLYEEDILYIDPPYNHRQYGPNYHLYETFVLNDDPAISGKTGLRDWASSKSSFCSKKRCLDFTEQVILSSTAKVVFISYSSDGLFSLADAKNKFGSYAGFEVFQRPQRRYRSDNPTSRKMKTDLLYEYLMMIVR